MGEAAGEAWDEAVVVAAAAVVAGEEEGAVVAAEVAVAGPGLPGEGGGHDIVRTTAVVASICEFMAWSACGCSAGPGAAGGVAFSVVFSMAHGGLTNSFAGFLLLRKCDDASWGDVRLPWPQPAETPC